MPSDGFALRPAVASDAGFLASMVVAAVTWDPASEPAAPDAVLADPRNAHYVEGWPRAGDLGVVAVDPAGAPVGAAWLRLFEPDDPGYGFVAPDVPELSLGVVEAWRRRGVGGALLREVVDLGAAHGYDRISLSVERANPAQRLYQAEGFVVVGSGVDADTMLLSSVDVC